MSKYPDWFQSFIDAPTDDLPGFFGDWLDVDCEIEETDDSITLSGRDDFEAPYERQVTLYGGQKARRVNLVFWLYETVVLNALGRIVKEHRGVINGARLMFCDLPIRLNYGKDEAEAILGTVWK